MYRELHTRLERITEFYQNNTQQVIDAVAKHHNIQAEVLQGTCESCGSLMDGLKRVQIKMV